MIAVRISPKYAADNEKNVWVSKDTLAFVDFENRGTWKSLVEFLETEQNNDPTASGIAYGEEVVEI